MTNDEKNFTEEMVSDKVQNFVNLEIQNYKKRIKWERQNMPSQTKSDKRELALRKINAYQYIVKKLYSQNF